MLQFNTMKAQINGKVKAAENNGGRRAVQQQASAFKMVFVLFQHEYDGAGGARTLVSA